tara:strand:+ start:7978 stop:8946 length:969 start_codon:yes stop_codon:yes gene_type:complete
MIEKFRFLDALTYGIRTLFWRPVRAAAYIAALSLLYAAYYMWAQSDAGMSFFSDYMQSAAEVATGGSGSFGGQVAALMAGAAIFSCAMIAGAYRVYVRDEPALRLPLQIGFDELRMLGVYILTGLIFMGVMLLAMIPLMLIIMAVIFLATQAGVDFSAAASTPSAAPGIGLILGVMVPMVLFEVYVFGRLSVGFALAIRDRKFRLGGWNASKGVGLKLAWAHLALYLVMMLVIALLSPTMISTMMTAMTDPAALQDPAAMAAVTVNPYGNAAWLAIPVMSTMTFLMFGPTAAVANWDARKRAAAAAPAMEPAPGVGTGEAGA